MIADLKRDGFHISLWQLPYFVPQNSLFPEILAKGLAVKDAKGNLPYEDAVLDFTQSRHPWRGIRIKSPACSKWAWARSRWIFGEAAPLTGVYANGRTGFYEHNLYPLRYNQAVADITRKVTGENIIWARSAWAAASAIRCTGRRRGQHDTGIGGRVARRPFLRAQRLQLLEPTTSAASLPRLPRNSTAAGCPSAC